MSNDVQSKIGEGLSKFQGGIEQGKQRLQTAQEISRLKKNVQDSSQAKSKILLQLGQLAYQKMRDGQITASDFFVLAESLPELDKNIFAANVKINELNQSHTDESTIVCPSCEAANSVDDKFCGGCGTKLEKPEETEEKELVACTTCEESVPSDANFCPCCGTKAS